MNRADDDIRKLGVSRNPASEGPERLFTMSDKFNFQLKLHGLHKDASFYLGEDSDADNVSLPDQDPLDAMAAAAINICKKTSKIDGVDGAILRPGSSTSTSWHRRHSITAARKNNQWAEFFISASSSQTHIAAFISFKDEDEDGEYFLNPIPQAVINKDDVYKELLAVYNAIRFWSIGSGKISGKRVLIVCGSAEASKLMKKAMVKSKKVTPQIIMLLKEINQTLKKQKIDARISTVTPETVVHTVAYALARSRNSTVNKRRFDGLLIEQEHMRGDRFKTKEVIFPPLYL